MFIPYWDRHRDGLPEEKFRRMHREARVAEDAPETVLKALLQKHQAIADDLGHKNCTPDEYYRLCLSNTILANVRHILECRGHSVPNRCAPE